MIIFTCEDTFEDMMTCIFEAWAAAAQVGHSNIRLMLEPVGDLELFCEYRSVIKDTEKTGKVIRTIYRKLNENAYQLIYKAAMSFDPKKLDAIYRFLILGFSVGPSVLQMLQAPQVMTVFELSRKVTNEAHLFREFLRFERLEQNVLAAHIAPQCNILTILGPQFSDRMPSENWMIIDDTRNFAAVHPADQEYYLTPLTALELEQLTQYKEYSDPYVALWKSFFQTIGIRERKNYKCQRTMMPLWYRKNMTEFNP